MLLWEGWDGAGVTGQNCVTQNVVVQYLISMIAGAATDQQSGKLSLTGTELIKIAKMIFGLHQIPSDWHLQILLNE